MKYDHQFFVIKGFQNQSIMHKVFSGIRESWVRLFLRYIPSVGNYGLPDIDDGAPSDGSIVRFPQMDALRAGENSTPS